MEVIVDLYSTKDGEIKRFLNLYYEKDIDLSNSLKWSYRFDNPVKSAELIGAFIDNNDKFNINMWVSLDPEFFINVTDYNADKIIRYLFERYPY